jgi:hypothetical protein
LTPFIASFLGLKQDGVRYVFSYFPPLAVISGYGLFIFLRKVKSKPIRFISVFIVLTSLTWTVFKFRPYYLDYYNILVGGVKSVHENKLYDYDWWGEGIKEAVLRFNSQYEDVSVLAKFHPSHTAPRFDKDIKIHLEHDSKNPPDYVLVSEYHFYYNKKFEYLKGYEWYDSVYVENVPLIKFYRRVM